MIQLRIKPLYKEFVLPLHAITALDGNSLITVQPSELRFQFVPKRQAFCDLEVLNNSEHHVAFKVKVSNSNKKYFVQPKNINVIQPRDSCIIKVILRAQQEYPRDRECKDKFLIQSTIVNPNTKADEIPRATFNKGRGKLIKELKLRVVYFYPPLPKGSPKDDALTNSSQLGTYTNQIIQHLKKERDAIARENQQLQHTLDMIKRRRDRRSFTFSFVMFTGLIGFLFGLLLKLSLSSSPAQ